jgi:CRISPR system Cascade subunit CasC
LGFRTQRVVDMVVEAIQQNGRISGADAAILAETAVTATGLKLEKAKKGDRQETKYLVLVSAEQAASLARAALDALDGSGGDLAAAVDLVKNGKKAAKDALLGANSVDLALFGRMVADDTDLNVDAACQVAHAISVHAVDTEFDYFTAVDDFKDRTEIDGEASDAGAGMIGTVEFNSGTLYRYATVNVDGLIENLGDPLAARRAIVAFVTAFVRSMPTGKSNTFANHTLPEAVVVCLRGDQPVSYVGAFEKAVRAEAGSGYVGKAVLAMREWASHLDEAYGIPALAVWTVGVGPSADALRAWGDFTPFNDLPARVSEAAVALNEPVTL